MTSATATIHPPTLADIRAAAARIAPYAHRTPVMTSATIDQLAGRSAFFKCELFQKIGAFKFRGACNAVMKLSDDVAKRGVVTHSSGNHAQALALAARLRGIPAYIVMPRTSSAVKIRAVEGYGGQVTLCEPNQAAREGTAEHVAAHTGATLIPPYDHPDIIAGQGTLALELLEQGRELIACRAAEDPHPGPLPPPEVGEGTNVDAIIAPIGGGGMFSGVCIAAHGVDPKIKIIAAEPAGADDVARSLAQNKLLSQDHPNTIADGLLTGMSQLTWSIVRQHVHRVITAGEPQIISAMRLVWERMKILIEPSAAVPVAVLLSDEFKALHGLQRVGVVLSGGNVDLDKLPWVNRG
jgi:threonine dehydratase/serine racemase